MTQLRALLIVLALPLGLPAAAQAQEGDPPSIDVQCTGAVLPSRSGPLPPFVCDWTSANADRVIILGLPDTTFATRGTIELPADGVFTFVAFNDTAEAAVPVSRERIYEQHGSLQSLHTGTSLELADARVAGDYQAVVSTNGGARAVAAVVRQVLQDWGHLVSDESPDESGLLALPVRQRFDGVVLTTEGFVFHDLLCDQRDNDCDRAPRQRRQLLKVGFVVWVGSVQGGTNLRIIANLVGAYRREGRAFTEITDPGLKSLISRVLVEDIQRRVAQ